MEISLCPLAPCLWEWVMTGEGSEECFILDEVESFARSIAEEYNIKMTGSYNPYRVRISNEDFSDCRHI